MKLSREELAHIQDALGYAHVKAGSPTLAETMKRLRDRIQSYLLSDSPTVDVEKDKMVALSAMRVDGVMCVMVDCADFDHYKRLPQVVNYLGVRCGKTGWNSDTNRAHYQSNATIVTAES